MAQKTDGSSTNPTKHSEIKRTNINGLIHTSNTTTPASNTTKESWSVKDFQFIISVRIYVEFAFRFNFMNNHA